MHILAAGKRYDFSALNRASLLDLIELKKQTGLTMSMIGDIYGDIAKRSSEPGYTPMDDDAALMLFAVLIWLSRRGEGEIDLPFRESASMPLTELQIVADDDDAPDELEEQPDPTRRSDSGPGASGRAASPARSRSTTSRRRSTSTSSPSPSSGRASRR